MVCYSLVVLVVVTLAEPPAVDLVVVVTVLVTTRPPLLVVEVLYLTVSLGFCYESVFTDESLLTMTSFI